MEPETKSSLLAHVVLTSFYDHVPHCKRTEILERCRGLGEACGGREAGIVFWSVQWNLDQRKSYHLMLLSIFKSLSALETYCAHPEHRAFAMDMSCLSDWVIGDVFAELHEIY